MVNVFLYIFVCIVRLRWFLTTSVLVTRALISRYLDGLSARVLRGVKGEAARPKEAMTVPKQGSDWGSDWPIRAPNFGAYGGQICVPIHMHIAPECWAQAASIHHFGTDSPPKQQDVTRREPLPMNDATRREQWPTRCKARRTMANEMQLDKNNNQWDARQWEQCLTRCDETRTMANKTWGDKNDGGQDASKMTTIVDCELLAEWNRRRESKGFNNYWDQLSNPPPHISEAILHSF